MAPNSWLSLVLAACTKDALQSCIQQIQASSPVPLDPMSYTNMHMTLVFLGSNIRGLTPTKRTELERCMQTFGVEACGIMDASLKFETLELFPPAKRNLLIAKYHIKGDNLAVLRKLQVACYELGLVSEEEHTKSQNTVFVAHVTLGKFRGMRVDQISSVEKAIDKANSSLDESAQKLLSLPFAAACLCGGG